MTVALFMTLFLAICNYTLPLMAGVYIVGDLGGSFFTTTYSISFFCIGNALGIPLGRAFSDRLGSEKALVYSIVLFSLLSWTCGMATTYPAFIILRFLQGFVCGPFYTLIIRLLVKHPVVTAITLTIFVVTPAIGACLGGWIAYDYNWRWPFYWDLPVGLCFAGFIAKNMKNVTLAEPPYFDGWGYFYYGVGIVTLGFVFTMGQELDWHRSNLIVSAFIIGSISLVFWILRSFYLPGAILNLRLFKNFPCAFALLHLAFLFSAYFGMIILLSSWLSLYVNYTPLWIALIIGCMAIAGVFPTFLLSRKSDCRISLCIALIFFLVSSFHTSTFSVDINFGRIAFSRVLAGFGVALFIPPIFRLCYRSFPDDLRDDVLEVFQVVRVLSCGLGAAIYTIIWHRRMVFYMERLGAKLTVFSQQTNTFFEKAPVSGLKADAVLNDFLERQATALALDDCFYLMGWIMAGLLVLNALTLFGRSSLFFPDRGVA